MNLKIDDKVLYIGKNHFMKKMLDDKPISLTNVNAFCRGWVTIRVNGENYHIPEFDVVKINEKQLDFVFD